jgi:replicative DNA helicase
VIDGKHAAEMARMVAGMADRRRIIATARKVATLAANVGDDTALERVEALAVAILDGKRGSGPRHAGTARMAVLAEVDEAQSTSPEKRGVRTGIAAIDNVIGGLVPGSMTLVAARPSQGKSSLSTTIIERQCIEGGVPCALFTVEVSMNVAIRNIACCHARVDGFKLMHGKVADEEYVKFTAAISAVTEAPLYIDDGNITAASIRASIRRLVMTHGIKFAVVDYIQILVPEPGQGKGTNREREVAAMSQTLKLAAKESGIPIIVLAQINREVERRESGVPKLSDLRESGSLEADADIVLLLWGDPPQQDGAGNDIAVPVERKYFSVAKNRNGPVSPKIPVMLHKPFTRFEAVQDSFGFSGPVDAQPLPSFPQAQLLTETKPAAVWRETDGE